MRTHHPACPISRFPNHAGGCSCAPDDRAADADVRQSWAAVRAHVTTIAEAGARNDDRQAVFVEIRDLMARLEAGWR